MSADRGGRPAHWRGQPMGETVRTIAAKYGRGERIRLRDCPDPGTVTEVRCESGRIEYRAHWPRTPLDDTWYDEDEVEALGDDE